METWLVIVALIAVGVASFLMGYLWGGAEDEDADNLHPLVKGSQLDKNMDDMLNPEDLEPVPALIEIPHQAIKVNEKMLQRTMENAAKQVAKQAKAHVKKADAKA